MTKKFKLNIKLLLMSGLILRLFLLFISSYHPDILNHLDWGNRFWVYGSKVFYEGNFWGVSWPNQPYGTIVLFALISKLNQAIFSVFWYLNTHIPAFPSVIITLLEKNLHLWLVKLPFILSDIALAFLIYKIVQNISSSKALIAAAFFLFNPLVLYNSTVWGQTDSLINLLSLAGIWLTFNNFFFIGPFIFLSSYLFKVSLIIYLPVFILLLIYKRRFWYKFIPSILIFFLFSYLLAIPFTPDRPVLDWMKYMYTNRVLPRQGHMLNGNAYNFWYLLTGFDYASSEFTRFFNITAKNIGYFLTSFFFLPLLLKNYFAKNKDISSYIYLMFLLAFTAFMFLTNIHERYLYPIFPLFSILLLILPNPFSLAPFLLISAIHLLNLYNLWFYPFIPVLKNILIFDHFLIGRVFSLVLFAFYLYFYVKYLSDRTSKK